MIQVEKMNGQLDIFNVMWSCDSNYSLYLNYLLYITMQFTQNAQRIYAEPDNESKRQQALWQCVLLLPTFSINVKFQNDKLLLYIIHEKAYHMEFIPTMEIVSILL